MRSSSFKPATTESAFPALEPSIVGGGKPDTNKVEGWDKHFSLRWPFAGEVKEPSTVSAEGKEKESQAVAADTEKEKKNEPDSGGATEAKQTPPATSPGSFKEASNSTTSTTRTVEMLHPSSEHLHPEKGPIADDHSPLISDGRYLYVISRRPVEKKEPVQGSEEDSKPNESAESATPPAPEPKETPAPSITSNDWNIATPSSLGSMFSPTAPRSNRVFIGGVPYSWNQERIIELILPFGALKTFTYEVDEEGFFKGYAFCEYRDPSVTGISSPPSPFKFPVTLTRLQPDTACAALTGLKLEDKTLLVTRESSPDCPVSTWTPPPVAPQAAPTAQPNSEWPCPSCTFLNPLSNLNCEMCNHARPLFSVIRPPILPPVTPATVTTSTTTDSTAAPPMLSSPPPNVDNDRYVVEIFDASAPGLPLLRSVELLPKGTRFPPSYSCHSCSFCVIDLGLFLKPSNAKTKFFPVSLVGVHSLEGERHLRSYFSSTGQAP